MSNRNEALIDKLQVIIPRLERLRVTLRQQEIDVAAALEAALAMPDILKNGAPPELHYRERRVQHLDIAILRAGLAVPEVAHLTAISEHRLRAISNGNAATPAECERLMRVLPDWQPSADKDGAR